MIKLMKTKAILDNAARNTILAALKHYQDTNQGNPDFRSFEVDQVATGAAKDLHAQPALDDEGLDELLKVVWDVDVVVFS